jgi:hypothetical protein
MAERPQYGEYATPEEVAAAFGTPPPPRQPAQPDAPQLPPPVAGTAVRAAPPAGVVVERSWNRILTTILIALGAYRTVVSFFSLNAEGDNLAASLKSVGYTGFTSIAEINELALTGAVLQAVFLGLAVVISLRLLRAGRISFWVPLVAALICWVVIASLYMGVIVNDPAYATWVESQR